jgi:serine/threonine protein kinase
MNDTPDDPAKPPESLDDIELPPLPGPAWPIVSGYEILGELGSGSIGTVYTAKQLGLDRVLALKVIRPDAVSPDQLGRFHEEVRAIAQLDHPGVVPIRDVGEWQPLPNGSKVPFLASEYIAGGSLAGRLRDSPIAWPEAARLVEKLARTLHLCHSRGIVHGNLKPANVLMGEDGLPRLSDFARVRKMDSDIRRILVGLAPGTVAYLAPEQIEGKKAVGPAVDVYALGAVLYQMLSGKPPFSGKTPRETLANVTNEPPPSLRDFQVDVLPALEELTLRCLAKSPDGRPGSALELADELRRILDEHSPQSSDSA